VKTKRKKRKDKGSIDEITPESITLKLIKHCQQTTKASRRWVGEHPDARMPSDRSKFKGKMDHTTCICLKVGTIKCKFENLDGNSTESEEEEEAKKGGDDEDEGSSSTEL